MDIIDAAGVRAHLSMAECIDAMTTAMMAISAATATMPPRTVMPLIDKSGYFAVMPGSLLEPLIYGAKVVSLHPANPGAGRPAIQGFVALFDHATGQPLALVDGAEITALRTAAVSGLATRLLARADSSTLGLLGYGVQASAHLEAICTVRDIREVRVWGRSWERARAFAERHSARLRPKIVPVAEPQAAAACNIVCAVTASAEPVIRGEWIRPGTHVNLVGAHSPKTRESDTALVKRGRVYVDALASAFSEAGDILIPIEEGAIASSHVVGEIGAVLLGRLAGRATPEQITVYKSLGVVAQDLVATHAVYLKSKQT
jgi:ornithine cyclodeaminase/alanine dehydrogenase-like protein (mu-crystallin family)